MSRIYRRRPETDEEPFEDELVVMNTLSEEVVALNAPARVLWEALAEGATAEELAALFAAAGPEARESLDEALAALTDAGLIVAVER